MQASFITGSISTLQLQTSQAKIAILEQVKQELKLQLEATF